MLTPAVFPPSSDRLFAVTPALSAAPPTTSFETVAAVARLIGETLELRQVFARVAEAARGALTFDRMNVFAVGEPRTSCATTRWR